MSPPPIEEQRRQLATWQAERELDLALADDHPSPPAAPALRYDVPGVAPRPGEIHLLRPVAAPWGPVYVLLLEPAGSGFLAIPFGRYATPAVPGEWSSGIDATPLQVLCGWNSRIVAAAHLLPGSAKRVGAKQLADARAMHRIVHGDGAAAAHEAARFGSPLLHPADPRYEYLDEERERLDAHLPVAREQEEDGRATRWLLAAEGRPRYGCDDDA